MSYYTIGLDPGMDGAIAFRTDDGIELILMFKKDSPARVLGAIKDLEAAFPAMSAFMEIVNQRKGDTPTTAFKLGYAKGRSDLILEFAGITPELITAHTWQIEFGLGGLPDYETRKSLAWEVAKMEFPETKILKPAADACLIAEYGYRKLTGTLRNANKKHDGVKRGSGVVSQSDFRNRK